MWRYKNKEEKNYKDRKIFNDGIDSAHHCTLYKALWHTESTIYILAMVLINSGYSILDKKSMTWVERENYFLSYSFQNARQPDLLPGRG